MLCGRTEEVGHTVRPPLHRHFVGFSSVPVRDPTRGQPFYGYYEKPSHFSHLLRRAWGYGGPILILNSPDPHVCFYFYINLDIFLFIILF